MKELAYMLHLNVLHVILVNIAQVEEQLQMVTVLLDMSAQEVHLLQHQLLIHLVSIIGFQDIIKMVDVLKDIIAQLDLIIQFHVLKVLINQVLPNHHVSTDLLVNIVTKLR